MDPRQQEPAREKAKTSSTLRRKAPQLRLRRKDTNTCWTSVPKSLSFAASRPGACSYLKDGMAYAMGHGIRKPLPIGEPCGQRTAAQCFIFHAAPLRTYSKDAGALEPGKTSPDWTAMGRTLARLFREPGRVWGITLYPETLKSVKLKDGR